MCQKFSSVIHGRETEKNFCMDKGGASSSTVVQPQREQKNIKIILRQTSGMESFSLNIEYLAVRKPPGAQAHSGKQRAA